MSNVSRNLKNIGSPQVATPHSFTREQTSRLAREALKRYGLQDVAVKALRISDSRHLVRVTRADQDKFVLRMYRLSYAPRNSDFTSEEAIRSQALWLEALSREAELSVPEPVPTLDGALTSRVSVAGFDRLHLCLLQRWVPGRPKAFRELNPDQCYALGAYVARMHKHAEGFVPPKGFRRPRWSAHQLFRDSAPLWNEGRELYSREMSLFYAVAKRVFRDLRKQGEGPKVFGLVHRDLNLGNILFSGNAVSVVDFDACGWGYYLYDLASVLLSAEDSPEDLRNALLEGYQSKRLLSDDQIELLPTFEAMRRVARINRSLSRNIATDSRDLDLQKLRELSQGERGPMNYVRSSLSILARRFRQQR